MAHANVTSLDDHRSQREPSSEFDPVTPDDLASALDERDAQENAEAQAAAGEPEQEPTAEELDAIEAEQDAAAPGDTGEEFDTGGEELEQADGGEQPVAETPAEDTGPCRTCNGKGTHELGGGEWETCTGCSGTGREGAQGTLGIDGAGDTHADTGQARMFAADAYDEVGSGSRLGGRRATTGKVAISGASVDALKLDPRNRIPKGATIRLEVVGTVMFVGERDKLKDGFHAGTVREHSVKASHVQVSSWMHDEDGLRWDEEHGLRERVRDGVWRKVEAERVEEVLPADDADEATTPAEGGDESAPETAQDGSSGDEATSEVSQEPEAGSDAQEPAEDPAPATSVPAIILGKPETYTPEALADLKKDDLRAVLDDLGVKAPSKADRATLLAMATGAVKEHRGDA